MSITYRHITTEEIQAKRDDYLRAVELEHASAVYVDLPRTAAQVDSLDGEEKAGVEARLAALQAHIAHLEDRHARLITAETPER